MRQPSITQLQRLLDRGRVTLWRRRLSTEHFAALSSAVARLSDELIDHPDHADPKRLLSS